MNVAIYSVLSFLAHSLHHVRLISVGLFSLLLSLILNNCLQNLSISQRDATNRSRRDHSNSLYFATTDLNSGQSYITIAGVL